MALVELSDQGINYINNDKTVREWNIDFRQNELLTVSNISCQREPSKFSFSPEARTEFVIFCNKKVKTGELSTEAAYAELTKVIIPCCYSYSMIEAGEEGQSSIPSYNDLQSMLGY